MSSSTSRIEGRRHLAALAFFLVLSLLVSWPLVRDFRSAIPSDGLDARHHLWNLWHWKEALLGHQPLYEGNLLYYPEGINLLLHGMGPVMAFLSLPFQPLGPEAGYNGSLLLGLVLTGYLTYLLLREMAFSDAVSIWGGVSLLLSPIHLAGIYGHLHKVFVGLTPLALLCLMRASRSDRRFRWPLLTALVLFLTLQHNGHQFVMTAMLLAISGVILVWQAPKESRWQVIRRLGATGGCMLLLITPQLVVIDHVSHDPSYSIDRSEQSVLFQPDLMEYVLPSGFHWYFGPAVLEATGLHQQVETAVALSTVALVLTMIGIAKRPKQTIPWVILLLIFFLFSLGPSLKVLGERYFSLPYALFVQLPGLGFIRTPGRFMMMGYLGLVIAASYGLQRLLGTRSKVQTALILCSAVGFSLLEGYPQPWPLEKLPDVPDFYRDLARDSELYGVLDLPIRPTEYAWVTAYASYYQMLQMTHQKGIASGYVSRVPDVNPTFPCLYPELVAPEPDFTVNGMSTNCLDSLEERLATHGYRYVVWHLPAAWPYWGYEADSIGYMESATIVQQAFDGRPPDYEDESVRVYSVSPVYMELPAEMGPRKNWDVYEGDLRWATSPAWIYVTSPRAQEAVLEITFAMMYTPGREYHVGFDGRFAVKLDGQVVYDQLVSADAPTAVPLFLTEGTHLLELELDAGNFQPTDYDPDSEDRRQLSFATRAINLRLTP